MSESEVSGTAAPNAHVELFSGDGRTFLAAVKAGSNGYFSWNGNPGGDLVLATATDTSDNTSEFSESESVPVELSLFQATRLPHGVQLLWRTETETNNLGFYLERTILDTTEDVSFVPGHGTTVNPQTYSFVDELNISQNISYRLRQVDFDGTVSYSSIVTISATLPEAFELTQPYPNPFNGTTVFTCRLATEANVSVVVYNAQGRLIRQLLHKELPAGEVKLSWNGDDDFGARVSSGLYFIQMRGGGQHLTQRVLLLQ